MVSLKSEELLPLINMPAIPPVLDIVQRRAGKKFATSPCPQLSSQVNQEAPSYPISCQLASFPGISPRLEIECKFPGL